jgi:hypothetical protein
VIETWKPIPGYEGYYSISSIGRVRRDRGGQGSIAGRVLTCKIARNGYARLHLSRRNRKKLFFVHRLVLLAFVGPPPFDGAVVNHLDGDKRNNKLENLAWCSVTENNRHAVKLGLKTRFASLSGEKNGRAILTRRQVELIRELDGVVGQRTIAELLGVSKSLIQRIRQHKLWRNSKSCPFQEIAQ